MDTNIITGFAYNQSIVGVYPSYDVDYINKRNMPMVDNTIQLYKNVSQKILLEVRSLSRHLMKIDNVDFYMNVIDLYTNTLLLRKFGNVFDSAKGRFIFEFLENDLDGLQDGKYSFSISAYTNDGSETVLYLNVDGGSVGSVTVSSGVYPPFSPSYVCDSFSVQNIGETYYISSVVPAAGQSSNNDGLNTIAVYPNNFSGKVFVQGSLTSIPTETDWFFILFNNGLTEYSMINSSDLVGFSFVNKAQSIRFLYQPDMDNTGTIDKILSRSSFRPQRS